MNTKELFEQMNTNEQLATKFEGVKDPQKFYEIARDNGLTDDFETMKETALQIVKEQSDNEQIDISHLDEVSGGIDGDLVSVVTIVATAASPLVSALFAL